MRRRRTMNLEVTFDLPEGKLIIKQFQGLDGNKDLVTFNGKRNLDVFYALGERINPFIEDSLAKLQKLNIFESLKEIQYTEPVGSNLMMYNISDKYINILVSEQFILSVNKMNLDDSYLFDTENIKVYTNKETIKNISSEAVQYYNDVELMIGRYSEYHHSSETLKATVRINQKDISDIEVVVDESSRHFNYKELESFVELAKSKHQCSLYI